MSALSLETAGSTLLVLRGALLVMVRTGEHLVGQLLLLGGHGVVERRERAGELLQVIDMGLRKRAVGLQVLHSGHRRGLRLFLACELLHRVRVVAHGLGDGLPVGLFGRRDLEGFVKAGDTLLDGVGGLVGAGLLVCRTAAGRGRITRRLRAGGAGLSVRRLHSERYE